MRKLTVILLCLLTSCGFHWRGELPLAPPLHHLYLQTSDPYGQLSKNLIQFLKLSGVHIAAKPEDASTVLVILNESTQQQLLGISGTQQTRQYNLLLHVTFSVTRPDGSVLVPPQLMTEVRTLTIKADQILAGSNEANMLYQQMRQAIVYNIMSRLASKDIATLLAPATI